MMLLLALFWGGSYFWSALALKAFGPFTIVGLRLLLGSTMLIVYVKARGYSLRLTPAVWRDLVVLGFLNLFFPFCLITWGQTQIASGLAAIFNAMAPLFAVVVAHFATRDERLTVQKLAGVALGIAGVAVMVGVDALRGLGLQVLAQLAVLGGALSYGCAAVYARRFRNQPSMVIATGQITTAAIMAVPAALIIEAPWNLPAPGVIPIVAIGGLAILSSAVSPLLYFAILKSVGATNAIIVTFLAPVSALLLGVLVLGEAFTGQQAAGIVLIGMGLAAIDGRPAPWLRRRLLGR